MSDRPASDRPEPKFFFKGVLKETGRPNPRVYSLGSGEVDKPDGGFRLPHVYFSWAILGDSRTLHHHQDHDELIVILEGRARIYLYGDGKPGSRFEASYLVNAGDVVVIPQGWDHSVQDLGGRETLKALLVFNNQDLRANEISNGFELPSDPAGYFLGENA